VASDLGGKLGGLALQKAQHHAKAAVGQLLHAHYFHPLGLLADNPAETAFKISIGSIEILDCTFLWAVGYLSSMRSPLEHTLAED